MESHHVLAQHMFLFSEGQQLLQARPSSKSSGPEPGLKSCCRGETPGIIVGFVNACSRLHAKLLKNPSRSRGITLVELPELKENPGVINPCFPERPQGTLHVLLLRPLRIPPGAVTRSSRGRRSTALLRLTRPRQLTPASPRSLRPRRLTPGPGPLNHCPQLAPGLPSGISDNTLGPSQQLHHPGHRRSSSSTSLQGLTIVLPAQHLTYSSSLLFFLHGRERHQDQAQLRRQAPQDRDSNDVSKWNNRRKGHSTKQPRQGHSLEQRLVQQI